LIINNFDCKAGFFVHRESVEAAAQTVGLNRNLQGVAFFRSFKNRVLDKVRHSVKCVRFVARTLAEKKSERDAADIGHLVGENR